MYKVVLFDLDGTVLNTLPDIRTVLNSTLRDFSLECVTEEQAAAYVGNGAYMLVKRACGNAGEETVSQVYASFSKRFASCKNELSTYYNGEREALKNLRDCGVQMGIITNKPHRATLNIYEKFFKEYGFFFVQGQEEGVPLKPSPEALLKAIEKSGAKKSECLFVGDGETDVQTAKNAGIDSVSVLWGYRSREQLEGAGATRFASNYKQLEQIILKKY